MNTSETAKFTSIPPELLIRMRARETRTLKSGPPFCKTLGPNGQTQYVYNKRDVSHWMKVRRCLITTGDAAMLLGIHREEMLRVYGLTGFEIRKKGYDGRLIVDNARNVYIWVPKGKKVGIR